MINSGWIDPLIQNKAYIDFAANAPGYGPLVSDSDLQKMNASFYGSNGCLEQQQACYAGGNSTESSVNKVCKDADDYCVCTFCFSCSSAPPALTCCYQANNVENLAVGNRDAYDLRQNSTAAFPPPYYLTYLNRTDVISAIGAKSNYSECPDGPYDKFTQTGDVRDLCSSISRLFLAN